MENIADMKNMSIMVILINDERMDEIPWAGKILL